MTAHLFLSTARAPFGEAVCGLELARAAHAAGDGVAFLHHSALGSLFADVPFPHGTIDSVLGDLARAVRDAVAARRFDTVTLVDALAVLGTIGPIRLRQLVERVGVPVFALDLWSCHETSMIWDVSDLQTPLDPLVLALPVLRPAPIARPQAPGAYRALPVVEPIAAIARAALRAELGLARDEHVIVTTTGSWQQASQYPEGHARRLATIWPEVFALFARRLGDRARVFHVGPEPMPWTAGGVRYHHVRQSPPAAFRRLLAAADLFVTNNVVATSLASAIALDVPALVLQSASVAATPDDLAAQVADPELRACLARIAPVRPWRVMPLGLHTFLTPVLAGNPYADAIVQHDIADLDGAGACARSLLDDGRPTRDAQARYRGELARLPSALDRLRELTTAAAHTSGG